MRSSNQFAVPPQGNVTAYLGRILNPVSFERYDEIMHGALLVDERGTIVDVCTRDEALEKVPSGQIVDFGKQLILPGLIDLHAHLVQISQTGRAGDTLLGWLEKYIFPAEKKFSDPVHAEKMANWFFHELAANGTTLAAVFTSVHAKATDIAFQTAAQIGVRVIMGKMHMDRNTAPELIEDANVSLSEAESLCKKWHGYDNDRLLYAFTPRFAPTCSAELMQGIAKLWKKYPGTYMQTHLSENVDEISWVSELFPEADSYFDVYKSNGLAGRNSLFAHAIHLTEYEMNGLVHHDCAVAHCPSSNFFLKSGVFAYAKARKAELKFGLGSDIAAGPEMSIFKVMKDGSYIQSELWLTPAELFYCATLGGAKAVNLAHKIGSFEPGKEADFIIVNPTVKTGVPATILDKPSHDVLSSLIYVGDDRMIHETYVRGVRIFSSAEAENSLLSLSS